MYKITGLTFIACFALIACESPAPIDTDKQDSSASSDALEALALSTTDLARPQPEKPICPHCRTELGYAATPDDDELSLIIEEDYVGLIDDLVFVEYTDTATYTHTFDQSVIDDLNDPGTSETIVMMDIPNAQRGLLIFDIETASYYEPIPVE